MGVSQIRVKMAEIAAIQQVDTHAAARLFILETTAKVNIIDIKYAF